MRDMPTLYKISETSFTTNGLGRLTDATALTVTEERNGQFELRMTYPVDGNRFSEIAVDKIIYTAHDTSGDKQPFRIYKITRPLNGQVTILARHISYRLAKMTVMPFEAANIAEALSKIPGSCTQSCPYVFTTDKTTVGRLTVKTPQTIRSLLGGVQGSILDTYGGGEYEWDHFNVILHKERGQDSGITIRYGVNLQDLEQIADMDATISAVVPYWVGHDDAMNDVIVTIPEKRIRSENYHDFYFVLTVPLDCSGDFQNPPTAEQLREKARAYLKSTEKSRLTQTIKLKMADLARSGESGDYEALQALRLCDTVTVQYTAAGIKEKTRISKLVYNGLTKRYDEITLGDTSKTLRTQLTAQSTASNTTAQTRNSIPTKAQVRTVARAEQTEDTDIIRAWEAGHIYITKNTSHQTTELLAMDGTTPAASTRLLRLSAAGLYGSGSGYEGLAETIDAQGRINPARIKGAYSGTLTVVTGITQDPDTGTVTTTTKTVTISHGVITAIT